MTRHESWSGTAGSARDERARSEELTDLRLAARASSDAKRSFLAHLGNTLSTPLHAILGNLELLDTTSCTADDRDRLAVIQAAAIELAGTVEGLMELAASEGRPFESTMEERMVSAVLDHLDERWRRRLATRGQLLVTQWDDDDEAAIVADWSRFESVCDRLLDNVHHHAGEGTVTVTLSHAHGLLTLTIVDPGPGFPPEHRDEVLEPFFRIDASPGSANAGAGIGLAVAARLLQAVGGSLRLEPSSQGTTAIAVMPRQRRRTPRPDST
jgi:signal transduction histidine kinase